MATMSESIAGIRERRDRAGITRQQLAEAAACSISHLANLERGITLRYSDVLPRVLAALDELEGQR